MKYRCSIFLFILAFLACSCKKDIDSIGLNLQDDDILNAKYVEIPLEAYSTLEDSINTKNLLNNVLGCIQDPTFGKTEAGFCTQFDLSGSNTFFDPTAILDSVVLTLQYSGSFGDTLSPLEFEVYKMAEKLDKDKYYSNDDNPQIESENLVYSTSAVSTQPNTSVYVDSAKTAPHLRIRLKGTFGNWLIHLPESSLVDITAFQEAFYGLCVRARQTRSGAGNLSYISLTSAMSGITLYYHVNGNKKKYTFPISTDCTRYNFYTHDYASGSVDFVSQVIDGNHALGQQILYAQPTGGVKTHVNLDALADSLGNGKKVIINRAELILTNISNDASYFFQPYNISLQVVNKDGTTSYTPDDAVYTSSDYFGGIYDENAHEYRFRITNYVQERLKKGGNLDNGLNVVISGAGVRGNRLVFRGTDPAMSDHFRLEVYYTEY